jgi:hypothetical protein
MEGDRVMDKKDILKFIVELLYPTITLLIFAAIFINNVFIEAIGALCVAVYPIIVYFKYLYR